MKIVYLAAFAPLLLPLPAVAAGIEPGLWQDVETGDVNGTPQPTRITTDCVKAEDAKEPAKAARAALKDIDPKSCGKMDIQESGNSVLIAVKCGDPKQGTTDLSVRWTILDAQHTISVAKSVMAYGNQTMTSTLKTQSQWLGSACRP